MLMPRVFSTKIISSKCERIHVCHSMRPNSKEDRLKRKNCHNFWGRPDPSKTIAHFSSRISSWSIRNLHRITLPESPISIINVLITTRKIFGSRPHCITIQNQVLMKSRQKKRKKFIWSWSSTVSAQILNIRSKMRLDYTKACKKSPKVAILSASITS